MRKRKTIRPLPLIASRWTAWASRLTGRHHRLAGGSTVPLLLHVALLRNLILLQQQCFSFHSRVQPRLNLAISSSYAWNDGAKNFFAPHAAFLKLFAGNSVYRSLTLNEHRGRERSPQPIKLLPALPVPVARISLPPLPLALVVARTNTEHISSMLHQQFSSHNEVAVTKVSQRLMRQVQRVTQTGVLPPPLALRKEMPAAVNVASVSANASPQRGFFEGPAGSTAPPSMTMPAFNVEQLANQVIQQIDRRVIARRERMGQI